MAMLFDNHHFIVVPGQLNPVAQFRRSVWRKHGAVVLFKLPKNTPKGTTYIVCEDEEYATEPAKVLEKLNVQALEFPVVKADWAVDSLEKGELLPLEKYAVEMKKRRREESDGEETDDDMKAHKQFKKGDDEPNALVIYYLGQMADEYSNTGKAGLAGFKAMSYRRAIQSIRAHGKPLKGYEDARKLPDVGDGIARKIEEIIQTGKLHQLEETRSDEHMNVVKEFLKVYGVGPTLAQEWYHKGYRSIEDVVSNEKHLSEPQKLGIRYVKDWGERIPRAEVAEHESYVVEAARKVDPKFKVEAVGSYARGAETTGDIDFLVMSEGINDKAVLGQFLHDLVKRLERQGYVKCTLAGMGSSEIHKFYGGAQLRDVCRRVDFLAVPWSERGAARIYFVGDDLFNRTLRKLAADNGMKLTNSGLFKEKRDRNGKSVYSAKTRIGGEDERKIFEALRVKWVPPTERNMGNYKKPTDIFKE